MSSQTASPRPAPAAPSPRAWWVFASLQGYQRAWLRGDVIAGLTVWAVLVPEALAYATIAGVSPVVGLYAAVPALILYAAFGSSRHLIVGPMSATAALSASVVGEFAKGNTPLFVALTTAVAVVTGALCLVAGVLRLGFLASFISEPVLKGFIIGLALTIIMGQVPSALGVGKGEGDFFHKLWHVLTELGDIQWLTASLAIASLVVLFVLRRVAPKVPGSLVVVLLGIVAVALFSLDDHGVDIVGHIDSGLPSFGTPDVSWSQTTDLIGPCLGVMLVGFAEALGAAKTYASRAGYDIDPNRELIGMGAANVGAGLSSGMVVNGSLSKTAVNGGAGAKSQVSGLTAAVLALLTLLFLTPVFEKLPEAVLAAVVIMAVLELVDIAALRRLWSLATPSVRTLYGTAARDDFFAAIVAALGVLVFDTLPGLIIGVILSLFLLLARASHARVAILVRDDKGDWVDAARAAHNARAASPVDGVLVVRPEAGLFFANAERVRGIVRALAAREHVELVVIDGETVPFVDVDAAQMFATLRTDLARTGTRIAIARDVGQVRDELRAALAQRELPPVFRDVDDAIAALGPAPSGERGAS